VKIVVAVIEDMVYVITIYKQSHFSIANVALVVGNQQEIVKGVLRGDWEVSGSSGFVAASSLLL
jgi:hypothetical protein